MISTLFIATAVPANAAPGDSSCDLSGTGSSSDPYLLSTEQDMFEMADCVDSSTSNNFFQMQNDIHLNSEWTSFNFKSDNAGGAEFDGGGFTLSGLRVTSNSSYGGLFIEVGKAKIKNLYLEVESLTGLSVGSVAEYLANSEISNVHVHAKGDISGSSTTGGVAARIKDSTVADVSFVSSGKVSTSSYVGGIAAAINNSTIGKLSVIADIESTSSFAGGISGLNEILGTSVTISGLSFAGSVSSATETGGLFGRVFDNEETDPSVTIEDSSVVGVVNSTTKNPGGFIGTLEVDPSKDVGAFTTGTSFVSAEMKKNGVTTTDGAVISPYSTNTSVTARTGTFYDTDKATYGASNANDDGATGKQTTQLKTLSQFTGSSFDMVTLAGYLSSPSVGDKWIISSDLNDGFPVLRSAYDSLVYGEPYRPQSLELTPVVEGFQVSFDEPIFDGGSAITSYEYSTDSGSNWSSLTSTTTSGVVTGEITGLDSDTVFSVTVRAVNAIGNSPASVAAISKPASADSVSKTWGANDFTIAQLGDQIVSSNATTEGTRSFIEWTLTDDETARAGAVWSKSRISFEEDFDLSAEIYLGDDTAGADGMAFVLQTSSSTSLSSGGGLGYSGISPALAVEFDTYNNSGDDAHANANDDYWSIKKNSNSSNDSHDVRVSGVVPSNDVDGDGSVETAAKEFTNPINGELEDDQWRKVRFTWDASADEFNAYFDFNADGDTNDNYERLQFESAGLIGDGSLFGTTPIYWGFTGSTGGSTNEQKVRFEQNLLITQTPVANSAPTITNPGSQLIGPDDGAQTLDVAISDNNTTQAQWGTSISNSDDSVATVSGSLTSAENLQLTITPVALGSTTVDISVTDADGETTTSSFEVRIGVPAAPYSGPVVSGLESDFKQSFNSNSTDTATFVGERLSGITKVSINGIEAELVSSSATQFTIKIPVGLTAGTYDLVIESSLGNLTYLDALTITGSTVSNESGFGEVTAWTKRVSETEVKVYVKYPTVGEKLRIGHQSGGSGSYESVFVKTTASEDDPSMIVNEHGSYIVRTIDLENINRIRVTVGDQKLVQVRYNN